MARIIIPPGIVEGFIAISNLNDNQLSSLSNFLRALPIGSKFEEIDKFLNSELNIPTSEKIVQTLVSFGELLEPDDVNTKELASDLAESLQRNYSELTRQNDLSNLEQNLVKIFESSQNLKLTLKAYNLVLENNDLYVSSKVITDIRLIFNDNITDSNRSAVIIHKLHLVLQNARKNTDIFITMDSSDLKKLKDTIDRAILKEDLIKEDYENVNFIDY